MEYRSAPEVGKIAGDIIAEHHAHLLGVRVEFVFLSKTPKSKGREVWGRAKKISSLNAFLASPPYPNTYEDDPKDFFVIEVSEEVWNRLTSKGREALIDHELSHLDIQTDDDGFTNLAIVGHDVTEFEAVLRRHGLWNESVKNFVEAGAEQLSFSGATSG